MGGHMTPQESFGLASGSGPTVRARRAPLQRAICAGAGLCVAIALACHAPSAASPDNGAAPSTVKEDVGASATAASAAAAAPAAPRALPAFCQGASADAPVPATAKAELVKDGFVFLEGPVWSDQAGAFFFSEMDFNSQGPNGPPSKIHRLLLPKAFEVFIPDAGSNGLAIDSQGLVACTHDTQTLSRYDLQTKQRSVLVSDFQGKHFNSPNDVAIHSAGHIYFSDPDWQLNGRHNDTGITGVYWRKPSGEVLLIDGDLKQPNGVTLSPDETKLYVGAAEGGVNVYAVLSDGSLGPRQHFADVQEPDGMAIDCAGRLFVASHAAGKLIVLAPDGKQIGVIDVAPRTTNAAFGGPDRKTLLITAGTGVYSIRTAVPGFPY
jgi:gluconolactonase